MLPFEERRRARIERLQDRAAALQRKGEATTKAGQDALSVIPFGQPILVGHHSEHRDRRYRARACRKLEQGSALVDRAEQLRRRALVAEQNTAIFSDDPTAAEQLADKIARLERRQQIMRDANRAVRRKDTDALAALGFSEAQIAELLTPDFAGRLGFPDYRLKNNQANIRRLKQRLGAVTDLAQRSTTEREIGDVRLVENVEDNRVQLFFPDRPSDEVRTELKRGGWRWSRSDGCWQRHLSNQAIWQAAHLLERLAAAARGSEASHG